MLLALLGQLTQRLGTNTKQLVDAVEDRNLAAHEPTTAAKKSPMAHFATLKSATPTSSILLPCTPTTLSPQLLHSSQTGPTATA